MPKAGAIQGDDIGVAFGPDRLIEIAVGPLGRIDVVVAVGGGEPGAFDG